MTIEMPRGLPFSVDTFSPSSKKKRYHFLTHAHKDHTVGISSHSAFPIYCTSLTKSLVLQQLPQLDYTLFVGIEIGLPVIIEDPDGEFTVTAFDANHCPGAVMFLFEGSFGNILHTGDCRLTPECLQCLPAKYIGRKGKQPHYRLDYIFLDCTFGKFSQSLPSKHSSIKQVINSIWKHPEASVVYLTCDLLGQDDILREVSKTFGSKIFVDKAASPACFNSLMLLAPEIISQDPSSRFHLFEGFPKLYERASAKLAEARYLLQSEPLIIRPSAQWYACMAEEFSETQSQSQSQSQKRVRFNEAVKDEFGIWHVCYSNHSSREELEWALQLLAPRWVVSTTPSCRAMELDYVRKNCFASRIAYDSPLWKLLDITVEPSQDTHDLCTKGVSCCPMVEGPSQDSSDCRLEPVIKHPSTRKLLSMSPPSKNLPITLFGRARAGFQESSQLYELSCTFTGCEYSVSTETQQEPEHVKEEALRDVTNEKREELELSSEVSSEVNGGSAVEIISRVITKDCYSSSSSSSGPPGSLSEELRKLYRSMNVAVPRPLPSLMELMNVRKRTRRKSDF